MTFKLTAKQRALAAYAVAQRFAHLRQHGHGNEPPADTLKRAADAIAIERPNDYAHAIKRLALGAIKTRRGNGIVRWTDRQLDARTWRKREATCDAARAYLSELLAAQPQAPAQPATQPAPPVRVNVVGTIDAQGATLQASADPLKDGQDVALVVNAQLDGQSPQQRVEYVDPLAAGQGAEQIDYTGEPLVRAALVDALRERRRGRTLRGLDSGELDLTRIAPTALGVDLERAYSRRIRPDVRGVAVWIALDASGSMRVSPGRGAPLPWTCAVRAAAMALRALERERIATALQIYGADDEHCTLRPFGAPLVPALAKLAAQHPNWYTNAPAACERGAAALAQRHEPRRVLMLLCDDDLVASSPKWRAAARAGVEVWPLLVGAKAVDTAADVDAAGWAAIPSIAVTDPANLVGQWTRALREHLGRVNA